MAIFEAEGAPMHIPGIKLTHIVSNEIHYLRGSFAKVLQQAYKMDRQRILHMPSLAQDRLGVVPVITTRPLLQSTSSTFSLDAMTPYTDRTIPTSSSNSFAADSTVERGRRLSYTQTDSNTESELSQATLLATNLGTHL
uniref:ATP synthase epsilon chain n=1 Tax=Lygus hesperus TaxID=30085 RepID=A0A0A9ZGJ8_LYGHE